MTRGIFPTGCNKAPLTALGVTAESARLSICSLRARTRWDPAAQMSEPESWSTLAVACPLHVLRIISMVGAGLMAAFVSSIEGSPDVLSEFALGVTSFRLPERVDGCGCRQTRL